MAMNGNLFNNSLKVLGAKKHMKQLRFSTHSPHQVSTFQTAAAVVIPKWDYYIIR